jgi:flagellar hook assembly protein FlgD
MGGRGAASGVSSEGFKYGTEFRTILEVENIKFIKKNKNSTKAPLETMSALKNRIYVTVNAKNKIKAITLYDDNGKRKGEIHLDHKHNGLQPHIHWTYDGMHTEGNTKSVGSYQKLINKIIKYQEGVKND